jgi:hypothetical protein
MKYQFRICVLSLVVLDKASEVKLQAAAKLQHDKFKVHIT